MTTSTRTALILAIAAAGLWSAKSVFIGTAGGLDRSPFEGPFFLAGLATFVAAAVALGSALTNGRPTWVRVVGGVVAPIAGIALSMVVNAVVGAFVTTGADRHWVWSEVNLWVTVVLVVGLAFAAHRREVAQTA